MSDAEQESSSIVPGEDPDRSVGRYADFCATLCSARRSHFSVGALGEFVLEMNTIGTVV